MTKLGAPCLLSALITAFLTACTSGTSVPEALGSTGQPPLYRLGPGDQVEVFVWRNTDLSTSVPIRPDGRISVPLVADMAAAGKTPSELAEDIETALRVFVQNPVVSVIVTGFVGTSDQQVRVVGQAVQPRAVPYRADLTLLDVVIAVGGLTEFASGNTAKLVRTYDGEVRTFRLRIDDLVRDGDISANINMEPGDVVIVPETRF